MRHEFAASQQKHESVPSQHRWFSAMSARAKAAMQRTRGRTILTEPTEAEMVALYAQGQQALDLADEASIRRMICKNSDIIKAIRMTPDSDAVGLYAFLPLNEFGAALLAKGQFDGTRPDPASITRPGEQPAALYEWLFFGPGLYFKTLPAIAELFSEIAPEGCAFFSRGSTEVSSKLLTKLGFLSAQSAFPEAQPDIVVLLPEGAPPSTATEARARLQIRQVRDFEALAQVISIRSATYLAEQFPLYAEEFDGNDFCATHLIGYVGDDPAGAIRIRYFGEFAKIERLAVKAEHRSSRIASKLVEAAVEHARQKGFLRFYGHASDDLVPFWQMFGGRVMEGRPPFRFANITYREMVGDMPPHPTAVRLGAPPMMTIRPEGLWDDPAPLDWSNLISDPTREALLRANLAKPSRTSGA